jgi:hypothetical protein
VSGKRRPTQVREDERGDILALARAGYTLSRIASTLDRDERTVSRVVAEERAQLREKHEDRLMAACFAAIDVAAAQGNAKPAIEMLDRLGSIPETSRQRTSLAVAQMTSDAQHALVTSGVTNRQGPTIQIGIAIPPQLTGSQDVGRTPETLELPVISGGYVRSDARSADKA